MGQKPSLLTPTIQQTVSALANRQLLAPALLFTAAHRPLAFAGGQGLALAAPLAGLLGITELADWAALLSDPEGPAILEQALRTAQNEPAIAGGNR